MSTPVLCAGCEKAGGTLVAVRRGGPYVHSRDVSCLQQAIRKIGVLPEAAAIARRVLHNA